MKIIMLGAPGAGKGTQAKMIADKYQIPHVSTGDIFRANIKNGTELGKEAKKYMDQGQLVPDELTVKILLDRVAQPDCANGYVLDGFPRTIPQAEVLDKALTELGDKIDFAINVDVPDENIVRRMSGRRACLKCGATYHIEHIFWIWQGTAVADAEARGRVRLRQEVVVCHSSDCSDGGVAVPQVEEDGIRAAAV